MGRQRVPSGDDDLHRRRNGPRGPGDHGTGERFDHNDSTLTVTGTGEPGATVTVSVDGDEIADDVLVDETGTGRCR